MVELVDEKRRLRVVADRHEEAVGRYFPDLVGDRVAQTQRLDLLVAEHLLDGRVQDEVELLVGPRRGRP